MANGEQDWDDGASKGTRINYKELFMQLPRGSHKLRIITNPFQFAVHKGVKPVGDKGFGRKVACAKSSKDDPCPLCEKGLKPQTRYLLGVICRRTGTYKVLDINYPTLQDIKKLKNDPVWGDPFGYDISIVVDPDGGPQGYYKVNPVPHKPLSVDDQMLKDNADTEFLRNHTASKDYATVEAALEKVLNGAPLFIPPPVAGKDGVVPAAAVAPATKTATKATKVVAPPPPADDDEDVFPDYQT